MGTILDLRVADESIEGPDISKSFKDEIHFESYIEYKNFLSKEDMSILSSTSDGEIVLGKKRDATFFEKLKMPFILNKALKDS